MPNTIKMDRRAAIQTMLNGGLVLSLMPGFAETAWGVIVGERAILRVLNAAQTHMIALIADVILPRTDTPGAIDVGVPAWIDLVLAEYFSEARRAAFLADLHAIDGLALPQSIATLDAASGSKDLTPAQRGYVQLKELILVGYFTSQPVQRDLLKVVILPGRFDGDVSFTPASAT
jgi:gluconate 2-dehydrogenase gamma chain